MNRYLNKKKYNIKTMNNNKRITHVKKGVRKLFFVLLVGIFSQAPAQTDVITGIEKPNRLAVHGDNLYVLVNNSKIVKIDLTESTPEPVDFITELSEDPYSQTRMIINKDDMYILQKSSNSTAWGCVKKASLTADTPSLTTVYDNNGVTYVSFGIHAEFLYLGVSSFSGTIEVIDLTESPVTVVSSFNTISSIVGSYMAVNATNLYLGNNYDLYNINLTTAPPETHKIRPQIGLNRGLVFYLDDLYVSEDSSVAEDNGKVIKFDPTVAINYTTIVSGLESPQGLAVYKDELYIAERGANKISKISLAVLSVDRQKRIPKLLYPNPASNYLQIDRLATKQAFTIFNVLGMQVQKGTVFPGEKIDITGLSKGVYSIQFGNNNGLQFIKK